MVQLKIVGVGNKNGRMWNQYTREFEELREQWNVQLDSTSLRFRHWGTETLVLDLENKEILEWYGESNSDRDSMNFVLDYFNIPLSEGRFVHRPVNGGFFLDK